jgi:hypothetical protein
MGKGGFFLFNRPQARKGRKMKTEIYNLKKMDFGRYLIENNIDSNSGMGLIANPEKYGKKNFEIMKFTYKSDTNAVRLINELINMIPLEVK